MRITNLLNKDLFLGFISAPASGNTQDVSSNGVKLPALGTITVDDRFRGRRELEGMISDGIVTVDSLNVADDIDTNPISANEFNSWVRGIYRLADFAKTGTIASTTAFIKASAEDGPFDTNLARFLKIRFDSLDSQVVEIELPRGQIPKAQLIAILNANTDFAKYAVASAPGSGWQIDTNALGVNANIEFLDIEGNAAELLGMGDAATDTAGTGTVATVTADTFNTSGEGVFGIDHALKLFTTDFNGGDTVDANHQIQRVTVGSEISGLFTAEAVIRTGDVGRIEFEVAQVSAGTEPFFSAAIPADHFLAQQPAGRLDLG